MFPEENLRQQEACLRLTTIQISEEKNRIPDSSSMKELEKRLFKKKIFLASAVQEDAAEGSSMS